MEALFKIGFASPATSTMEGIINLHNYLFFYLSLIFVLVIWIFGTILWEFFYIASIESFNKETLTLRRAMFESLQFSHESNLELFWTIVPSGVLLLLAIPSFRLIYLTDEVLHPLCTVKVIGHQWYWSAEYSDFEKHHNYDMNLVYEDSLRKGGFRLLETDLPLILPTNTPLRILVSSQDVLHSFSVNSLGIKIDACPGRLNQIPINLLKFGVFYGQCSEICGTNHAFMPIVVKVVTIDKFLTWFRVFYTNYLI
jgi:cytochrome c oxidase subunit 2